MKTSTRDSFTLKKPNYTSRIVVSPNTTSNKNGPKITYNRRGNSIDGHRDNNQLGHIDNDVNNENDININSLITQVPKGGNRPSTGGNLVGFPQQVGQQSQVNSPRPHSERLAYSVSPTRTLSKNMIKYLPPKAKIYANKKTLVLDLDETLVHSGFKPFTTNSDIILKIELDNKIHDIHVLVRPGVEEFLDRMSKHYELVVFTASLSKYADPLVDKLDPKRLCVHRLFRQHCTEINRAFVKDLKKLDRELKDNSPISYALNTENGFPIKNWYEDKSDRELYNITPILEFLAYVPDVRDVMKKIVEKNEISIPKALNIINNYHYASNLQHENFSPQNLNANPNLQRPSTNRSINEYIYKSVQGGVNISSPNNPNNNLNISPNEDKDSFRYNSNLTAQKERNIIKNLIPSPQTNRTANNEYRNTPNKGEKLNNIPKSDQENKQNINIKIINTHINHFIINQEGTHNHEREVPVKKHKPINTFRNSYNIPQQNNDSLNKSNNNQNSLNKSNNNISNVSNVSNIENLKNKNLEANKNNMNLSTNLNNLNQNLNNNLNNRFNIKNLNLNIGASEVKSPILKNSTKASLNNFNPGNLQSSQSNSMANNYSRYSSLIDTQNYAQNSGRPSSAIVVKGRGHNRDSSTNSVKNDQINFNVNYNSPLARSPSSQSIVHHLNRNYSRQNLRKETPKHNYLTNIDTSKNLNLGSKTLRPSTTQEKLRINYNTGSSYSNHPMPNMNSISQIRTSAKYEVDEILNKRGYSLSSRAGDIRPPSYRFKENEKYQGSKFSATGIYRSQSKNK